MGTVIAVRTAAPSESRGGGAVVASQPAAEAVQAGIEHTLRNVGLVELVPHFPFQLGRDGDALGQPRVLAEPHCHIHTAVGHEAKERILIDDTVIQRGRLEKDYEALLVKCLEGYQALHPLLQHRHSEYICLGILQNGVQQLWQKSIGAHVIYTPDDAILIEGPQLLRDEMHGNIRGKGPVQHPHGEAVMLGQRQPVPHRIHLGRVAMGIALEGA